MSAIPKLRCAIYTRKSTEEGLEQAFNSLDAQREACEAYIVSQASLGWKVLPELYDDGGISGGTLERPALQRLLHDIKDRKIDVVVVYKIDRLTRALMDFSRIVEIFDSHGVSFVSITQQFNTTTSMGRLTLNVLLSFAQFEREVTAERIRDKVAASKKKGMWMGGNVPLGYELKDRKLAIDEEEARTVRWLYLRYLDLGSMRDLSIEARTACLYRRPTRRASGSAFGRGNLHHLLTNPIYVGRIRHKGAVYSGEHPAIVDEDVFNRVQAMLTQQSPKRRSAKSHRDIHLLYGLLRDDAGQTLASTHANNHGKRYRYYVSRAHNGKESGQTDKTNLPTVWRLSSTMIEPLVERQLHAILSDKKRLADWCEDAGSATRLADVLTAAAKLSTQYSEHEGHVEKQGILRTVFAGITLRTDAIIFEITSGGLISMLLDGTADQKRPAQPHRGADDTVTITVPVILKRRGVEAKIILEDSLVAPPQKDPMLIAMVAKAHLYLEALTDGSGAGHTEVAGRLGIHGPDISRILPMAFLAPKITEAILTGRQPADLTIAKLTRMLDLPMSWNEQAALLGS
ncbi:recombinase family protein [Shinella zoogloeoides]|uniref:recombinase family protein n=1 Tax=Shinella zoogloeoides TaxID=352475 RepID=UPI00273E0A83|nr:recombinase family protein [Shinella zoogloeoides]WLR91687.1 recombinase family protein [Shinella zoogloeoides]